MTKEEARTEISRTAQAMLSGAMSLFEGARRIASLRFPADLETDPDVMAFVGIDSETDAMPLGSVREYWQSDALEKLRPEIAKAEAWAHNFGSPSAERLAARFSN
ncbi:MULTISPECIES: DUF2489 domain-containing protein [unclassified Bosea (in: a-proteobacteria)]|uniref:DUF2489 domain-containing protein n=1 Tax=unclassified Bosea (in: a-proteobacteria) TaxID=2653178 RepID=UPI000F7F693A|nr:MULTISPECIES: DUF2489 domain-containing protein [unclassified Bosea (in: a-proteobacteria)]RXT24914.1 hypothetical protein B5U98_08050 [Bosea sp. Tri-39]RXT42442.1 hypothetical protein B5U99_00625 [Bosea sp. Tri-54]